MKFKRKGEKEEVTDDARVKSCPILRSDFPAFRMRLSIQDLALELKKVGALRFSKYQNWKKSGKKDPSSWFKLTLKAGLALNDY
jgi:hypothetical protein